MSAIKIPLASAPPVISESAIAVLQAHGFVIARRVGESGALEQLPPVRAAQLFREIGNNAAQGLVSLEIEEPDTRSALLLACTMLEANSDKAARLEWAEKLRQLIDPSPPEPAQFCATEAEAG